MLPVLKEKCMDDAVLISQKMEEILISGLSWNENVAEHFLFENQKKKHPNILERLHVSEVFKFKNSEGHQRI